MSVTDVRKHFATNQTSCYIRKLKRNELREGGDQQRNKSSNLHNAKTLWIGIEE